MSIPLPQVYHLFKTNADKENTEIDIIKSEKGIHVNDLYLDTNERYEIFIIKAAERPHLLRYPSSSQLLKKKSDSEEIDEKKSSVNDGLNNETLDPPIIDGCDIPGWRKDNIVTRNTYIDSNNVLTINNEIQSLLNIGPSSRMFRLDSQWPNIDKLVQSSNHRWKQLRKKLIQEPLVSERAQIVEYNECCQLVKVDKNKIIFRMRYNMKLFVSKKKKSFHKLPF